MLMTCVMYNPLAFYMICFNGNTSDNSMIFVSVLNYASFHEDMLGQPRHYIMISKPLTLYGGK